jgi:hypothetical protein
MRWKAALLELLYDARPCRVAHEGLTKRTERDDFVVGHLARRLLRAGARRRHRPETRRESKLAVRLPESSRFNGDGLSCVLHANTGVHSNMSDVSVQATVSFIITFRKRTSLH